MKIKKLTRAGETAVYLVWDDAHEGPIALRTLRDACPCAGCQGESVLFRHYEPVPDTNPSPDKYMLAGAETVGSYAMKFVWGDGHGEGLYTWEHLRSLCGCEACMAGRAAAGERGSGGE